MRWIPSGLFRIRSELAGSGSVKKLSGSISKYIVKPLAGVSDTILVNKHNALDS